eukprot:scaffold29074_cov22-Tisochrysis_lutea.AAC.3
MQFGAYSPVTWSIPSMQFGAYSPVTWSIPSKEFGAYSPVTCPGNNRTNREPLCAPHVSAHKLP